jgi:hypothetical protein
MNDVTVREGPPTRIQVDRLQDAMSRLPQAVIETKHWFADGMYCREMDWPAGVVVVGKVHRREHLFILLKGEATFSTDEGLIRCHAPQVIVGKPDMKRVGYAHTDCTVLNIHKTNSRDLDEIELELIEPDEKALFDASNRLKTDQLEQQ